MLSCKCRWQKARCELLIWVSAHLRVVTREAVAEPEGRQAEINPRNMQSVSYPVANPTERMSVKQ